MDRAAVTLPRPVDPGSKHSFRIGHAQIDPDSRDAVLKDGTERLRPQNLKVLMFLAERHGNVVSREELTKVCWEGRIIGDDVINRSISDLRQFAERAGGFKIETVPRAGYRLVDSKSRRWIARPALIMVVCAVILAGAFAARWIYARQATSRPATLTVALLPFAVDQDDPQTRSIGLKSRDAIARMVSDGGSPIKLVAAAARTEGPKADYFISGNVSTSDSSIVATVRMEDGTNHVIIFSRRFEASRSTGHTLPDQIGADVASSLSWTAPLLIAERKHHADPTIVSELFSRTAAPECCRYSLEAYRVARRVGPSAPDSIIAQVVLAYSAGSALQQIPAEQRVEATQIGRNALKRAIYLAPDYGDVRAAWCTLHSPVRMNDCERQLRLALQINPDAPWAGTFLDELMAKVGRHDEALGQALLSLARDQYEPVKIGHVVRALEALGKSAEADLLYRKSLIWFPKSELIFWERLSGMMESGNFASIELLESQIGQKNLPSDYEPIPRLIAAVKANSLDAVRAACPAQAHPESFKSIQCMLALARLGDLDRAFEFAGPLYPPRLGRTPAEEQALWLKQPWSTPAIFITSRAAAPMRLDPRYLELARRVGLLAYWKTGKLPDFCHQPQPEPICLRLKARS